MKRIVKQVIDGDSFIVNRKINGTNKVRLAGVRSPERTRAGGSTATNTLRGLIGGKSVTIVPVGRSYDRVVAEVRRDRKLVNKSMRDRGYDNKGR